MIIHRERRVNLSPGEKWKLCTRPLKIVAHSRMTHKTRELREKKYNWEKIVTASSAEAPARRPKRKPICPHQKVRSNRTISTHLIFSPADREQITNCRFTRIIGGITFLSPVDRCLWKSLGSCIRSFPINMRHWTYCIILKFKISNRPCFTLPGTDFP